MNWTTEQLSAINKRGGRILVSAAAGSGKTAVLTNRIVEYLKQGGSLNRLLIVTFTKLAASVMKERIRKSIVKENNLNKSEHLEKQLMIVDNCEILTMDAFYNKILKENSLYLNVSPKFNIIDEVSYNLIKKEMAIKVLNNYILNDDYSSFFNNFTNIKKGEIGESIIIELDDFINKRPFPIDFIDKLTEIYQIKSFNDSIWSNYLYKELDLILKSYLKIYNNKLDIVLNDDILKEKLPLVLNNDICFLTNLINNIINKNFTKIRDLLYSFEFMNYPIIRGYSDYQLSIEIKNIRSSLKEEIKKIKNTLFKYNEEEFIENINKQKGVIENLIFIIKEYRQELALKRKNNNFLSFDDIPHLVIDLLIKNYNRSNNTFEKTEYANLISEKYDEILIDEYQDTNFVQDLIFRSISKNEKNLFVVGDIKQSIYGFRGSNPEIMIEMKKNSLENKYPLVINMPKNFRSRNEVIDFTNYIFSKIMSEEYGGIKYDDKEYLYLGSKYNNKNDVSPDIYIINSDKDADDDVTTIELEATFVAQKIKELINNNYQIFDSGINKLRNIKLSDIAILFRSLSSVSFIFRNALTKEGIEVYTDNATRYFDNYEIKLIISLLKIIINPNDEISLTAVLRSPMFNFSPKEITDIRNYDSSKNLYVNIQKNVSSKHQNFCQKIKLYQQKNLELDIDKLMNYLYNDTKLLLIFANFENGEDRVKNLLEMINHAKRFKDDKTNNLIEFIKYIDNLIKNNYSLNGANPVSEKESVLITTIHKSKGLEFPIVVLPAIHKKFNIKDLSEDLILDNNYFLSFNIKDYNNYNIIANNNHELLKSIKLKSLIEEEIRILYVALTRAKEKLIITATMNNISKKCDGVSSIVGDFSNLPYHYLINVRSYIDWLLPLLIKHKNGSKLRDLMLTVPKLNNNNLDFNLEIIDNIKISDNKIIDKTTLDCSTIITNLTKKIPTIDYKVKTNIAVTDIKPSYNKKIPNFIKNNIGESIGTIYHKIMEHIDFINYKDANEFKNSINNLINNNIITNSDIEKVNLTKIYNFFKTNFYIKIISNAKILREYNLFFVTNYNNIDNDSNIDEKVVVDGIIDLLCETDDCIYIIDFKSDNIDELEMLKRYQKQLDLYEKAIVNKENKKIEKYIYSFHLEKIIKI